jgi:T-complex protein 1 subunit delta
MQKEGIHQSFLVTKSAISFAAETVRLILKVDDILAAQ